MQDKNGTTAQEKHVDFSLPEVSDSDDSDNDDENGAEVSFNDKDTDASTDNSSEHESINPNTQSGASVLMTRDAAKGQVQSMSKAE